MGVRSCSLTENLILDFNIYYIFIYSALGYCKINTSIRFVGKVEETYSKLHVVQWVNALSCRCANNGESRGGEGVKDTGARSVGINRWPKGIPRRERPSV